MPNNKGIAKLAVVQAAPVFLDRAATVEKACSYIRQAGKEGAALVAFPESFIPAYPDWVWAVPPGEEETLNELYAVLFENAVEIPGPDTQALCQAARAAGVYAVVGITERSPQTSNGSLYNTLLYIDPQGSVMGRHRQAGAYRRRAPGVAARRRQHPAGVRYPPGQNWRPYLLGKLHAPGPLQPVRLGRPNLHCRHLGPGRGLAFHLAPHCQGRAGVRA